VALCDICQRVKTEHQRPAGLLQPLKIPEWRWEEIGMDFIVGLPRTHFIPIKATYSGAKLAELNMSGIICLHGVPKKIMSDRGSQFTSMFWEKLHESIDTKLNFSSTYHSQTDGQMERTNQILEDMLRACVLKYGKSWDKSSHMLNFHITMAIKLVSKWHHLRHCMDDSVEYCYFGVKLERVKYLV
jgi:transposase InsO family protein